MEYNLTGFNHQKKRYSSEVCCRLLPCWGLVVGKNSGMLGVKDEGLVNKGGDLGIELRLQDEGCRDIFGYGMPAPKGCCGPRSLTRFCLPFRHKAFGQDNRVAWFNHHFKHPQASHHMSH